MDAEEKLTIKGREFRIETTRVPGSTARVNIKGSLVSIRLPFYMSDKNAMKTYSDFREWAVRRLERMDHSQLDPKPRFIEFSDGQEVTAMGRSFTLSISEGSRRSSASTSGDVIKIRTREGLSEGERKRKAYLLARREIMRNVGEDLRLHVEGLNGRHFGFGLEEVAVRDQMTRWGSCSRQTGRISINFRLLLGPDEIRDYVILHELAHLRHPNHSQKFWKLVGSVIPDYKERRRWLNRNGNLLGVQALPVAQQAQ